MENNVEGIVKAYFEKPNKTLIEIFKEFTQSFTEEEKDAFYKNIKDIVN